MRTPVKVIRWIAKATLVLLALLVIVSTFLYFFLKPMLDGDITAGFSYDLADFVYEEHGRLPNDWGEFDRWSKLHRHGRWSEKQLNERFSILLHRRVDNGNFKGEVPRYVEVKVTTKGIKDMERYINERIHFTQLREDKDGD